MSDIGSPSDVAPVSETSEREALAEVSDPEWRMQGYYIGFDSTGLAVVDRILSAIAQAGKAYHNTDMWQEVMEYDYGLIRKGETCEDAIQRAANEAAATIRAHLALAPFQPEESHE